MPRRTQRRLDALEAQYREQFASALARCANGEWGLFGHNDRIIAGLHPREQSRLKCAFVENLLELGAEIEHLRCLLGIPGPFEPHHRLMLARSATHANTPGEPKRARQWLDEIQSP